MPTDKIKIATSIPGLKDKIQTNITGSTDVVYWYIKFNIPLDERSVSEKTMDVTDTDGYVMRTDIAYNRERNVIVISPLDTYEQNRYYLLNISRKVKSERGQNLKYKIHILFKLLNNQISEFKILKKDVAIPKPRPRPKNYDRSSTRAKMYSFDESILSNTPQDKLPSAEIKINLIVGIVGLLLVIISLFVNFLPFIIVSTVVCVLGVAHILLQLQKKEMQSTIAYNRGARKFNKEDYDAAEIFLRKAISANPNNELAEYAINKNSFYL